MSNPRIYIAIPTFLPLVGGAEMQALAQGRSLRERSYETTIITLHHDRIWPSREVIEGVPVIRVAGALLGAREKLPRLLRRLAYLVALVAMGWALWRRRRHYDILHVYQLSSLALPTALVSRLIGKPIIIALRCAGSDKKAKSHNKPSLLAGPLDATTPWLQVDGQTSVDGDLGGLVRMGKPVVRLTHALLNRPHAVVVVLSSRMKGYLAEHDFNLPDIQFIPNGVDSTRFQPAYANTSIDERAQVVIGSTGAINRAPTKDTSIDERTHVVVCVSKLRYEKGIDVLLQAWRLVHEQLPQAQLILVGDGPIQTQLEQMAQALGIAASVEFAGLQSDVPAQLHRGGLAILPSRWEGMPNAVLEAMACGLPCVATRVSGSEDIIQHGVNGLLIEPEDYHGMAQALLTLLHDPQLAQKYGHAARATIEKHYLFEHIVDRYIELYQRIIDSGRQIDTQPSTIYHLPS